MTSAISVKDRLKKQAMEDGKTMQDKLVTYGLERTMHDFPNIYNWINRNMEKYALRFFKEYISGFDDGKDNGVIKTEIEIAELKKSIERAIMCIESRAEDLVKLAKKP